jgi:hypothetical protein
MTTRPYYGDRMLVGQTGPHPDPSDEATADAANEERIESLRVALRESLRLQSHYAELLNVSDGGERRIFRSPDEWMERLREVGMLK